MWNERMACRLIPDVREMCYGGYVEPSASREGESRRKKDAAHRRGKEEGSAAYLHRSALEGAAEVGLPMKVSGNEIYLEMLGLEEVYMKMSGEEND